MRLLLALTLGLAVLAACHGEHDHDHDHDHGHGHAHHETGPNGGRLVELGSQGNLELVHDAATGTVRLWLWLTGPDPKAALPITKAPQLKLVTDGGPVVITMDPVDAEGGRSARFRAAHEALKDEHLEGRISVEVGGWSFNPDLEETHDH